MHKRENKLPLTFLCCADFAIFGVMVAILEPIYGAPQTTLDLRIAPPLRRSVEDCGASPVKEAGKFRKGCSQSAVGVGSLKRSKL